MKKKWLIVLTEEQYEWIKDTAKSTGLKGTHVIREIIERTMKGDGKEFRHSLASTQIKVQLQALSDKKAELSSKEQELKAKLQKSGVLVS